MPTYAYACTECQHHFEIVQSFTDDSLTECPRCRGRLRKLFNAVGVVFKGSGFYRTDSRGSGRSTVPGSSTSNGGRESATSGAPADGGVSTTGGDKGPTSSSGTSSGGTSSGSSPVSAAPASSA